MAKKVRDDEDYDDEIEDNDTEFDTKFVEKEEEDPSVPAV